MADAGQGGGFEMDLWVGTGELGAEIGESVGAAWQENLGVKVNLIKTAYSTYRPGLVARTNKTPGCLLYTSPSPRDKRQSRMPSSA